MRSLAFLTAVLLAAGPALAETPTPPARPDPPVAREAGPRATLDELFARLAAAADETEAGGIASLIERRFARSGSDTADLLMTRSAEALEAKDPALAIELLDRVTVLKPDWAEAWNRRAAAFYQLDDPASAMADIRQAITREPRHFNAWAALGNIEMASGDKRRAFAAFRQALSIHPWLGKVRTIVDRLRPEVDGRDL